MEVGDEQGKKKKKMRVVCLHGFRSSGNFLKKQLFRWDPSIFADFDLDFPNGLFSARGKSGVEGFFPPPYFEWFQFNEDFTKYTNLEECISYICDYIANNGPFDGLLGYSQGAVLAAVLMGYQAQGKMLMDHPPLKFLISISGSKFRTPEICGEAYKDPIKAKSVHMFGETKDWIKVHAEDLAAAFEDPIIVRHTQGHIVPRLDETTTQLLANWTKELLAQKDMQNEQVKVEEKSSNETREAVNEEKVVVEIKTENPHQKDVAEEENE